MIITIRCICCVCGSQYNTKYEVQDEVYQGQPKVISSHGFCQRHYDEAMANIEIQFAELPADGAHGEDRC